MTIGYACPMSVGERLKALEEFFRFARPGDELVFLDSLSEADSDTAEDTVERGARKRVIRTGEKG